MSYEIYHLLHLSMVILFSMMCGVLFFSSEKSKIAQIVSGISNFLILVAGMGLLARLGFSHGEPFPKWILVKIFIWLALAIIVPVGSKRLKQHATKLLSATYLLIFVAIVLVVWKPF